MTLSLQDLQDIAAICREGSFRSAARQLGISQPTLSSRVAQMERRIGAPLFDRSRGRSRPTRLAEHLMAKSDGLLGQLAGLANQAQAFADGDQGLVRLGLGPIPAYCMMEQLVARLAAEAPKITLVAQFAGAERLMGLLAEGEIDLAFCAGDAQFLRREIKRAVVLRECVAAIVSPTHPLAGADNVGLADVLAHPVALPVLDPFYRDLIHERLQKEAFAIPGAIYCSNYWLLKSLVETGHYVTLCTPFCFDNATSSGELVHRTLVERIEHELCLYTNDWSLPLPAIERVTAILRELSEEVQHGIDRRSG